MSFSHWIALAALAMPPLATTPGQRIQVAPKADPHAGHHSEGK